jgi:hypothetical protein
MFQSAVTTASLFTQPVIVSTRLQSGVTSASIATFVIVNDEGWVLTCAHVLAPQKAFNDQQGDVRAYDNEMARINGDATLLPSKRKALLRRLRSDPNWIREISYWWGADGVAAGSWIANDLSDLALGKLDPFTPPPGIKYPVFGNTANPISPGASLCRLGFPLHEVACSWDPATRRFTIPPESFPLPRFPLDGMYTRDYVLEDPSGIRAKFIETSTPGLRGQSGGPIFDRDARIWALQSRTIHYPLGFTPSAVQGSKAVTEHQFLNVGVGTHVDELKQFMTAGGVAFTEG